MDLSHIDLDLERLIRRTGEFAVEEFNHFSTDRIEYKGDNNPFTYVDVTAEEMLKTGCNRLIPLSGFINEETENELSKNGFTWIIDPIDGTSNFMSGIPHFSISVALQYEEETILGYVYEPVTKGLYRAQRGKGATLNGNPISVSPFKEMNKGLVATGFPYVQFSWQEEYMKIISDVLNQAHGLRRLGSAALDLAYVACGKLTGFFEYNLNPWDVAAGALLVTEAGGKVTAWDGGEEFMNRRQILATNGKTHQQMLEIIKARTHSLNI
ncbi:MAG: inositol monophosphatase [Bacteroidetes bacterium]|nr:inositol monophosphatase [Bacteroidota bacterium]